MNTKNVLIISVAFTICWVVMTIGMTHTGDNKRDAVNKCIQMGNEELACMCSHWDCTEAVLSRLQEVKSNE